MVKCDNTHYGDLFGLYKRQAFFFPLIGAVLLNEQDGVVFVDNLVKPSAIYVEHAFGFAQIFGTPSKQFELDLENYLLLDKQFKPDKIRLYTPYNPAFLNDKKWASLRSYRQRFILMPDAPFLEQRTIKRHEADIETVAIDGQNIIEVDRVFGVVNRFWRNPEDFIDQAKATVMLYCGQMASICYAAAEADGRVEIDVLTLPQFRALGIGKLAVDLFFEKCKENSLQPLWDCFTNNAGSMRLAESAGFKATNSPYTFYTIGK